MYLHRLLTDTTDPDIRVDHENYDTLDNRKNNLRVTNDDKNTKNRSSKNSNNKSGHRNVSWNGLYAEEMRQKYYGEYAGKS